MRALIARSVVALGTGAVLLAASVVVGAPAAGAAPVLSATPSTDLTDGQLITVTASGLSSTTHYLAECSGSTEETCELAWHQPSVPDLTAINTVIRARATVMQFGGNTVDCRTNSCVLAVVNINDASNVLEASTPLSFNPSAPLQPIPDLTVTPNTNVTFQQSLHLTSPAYLNPDDTVLLSTCGQLKASAANTLMCSVVSDVRSSNASGILDTTYAFNPNSDTTFVHHVTSGTCFVEDGCSYVAANWGSTERMLLGEVRAPGAVVPTTTTTAVNPTTSTSSTLAAGAVVATPRFTG